MVAIGQRDTALCGVGGDHNFDGQSTFARNGPAAFRLALLAIALLLFQHCLVKREHLFMERNV